MIIVYFYFIDSISLRLNDASFLELASWLVYWLWNMAELPCWLSLVYDCCDSWLVTHYWTDLEAFEKDADTTWPQKQDHSVSVVAGRAHSRDETWSFADIPMFSSYLHDWKRLLWGQNGRFAVIAWVNASCLYDQKRKLKAGKNKRPPLWCDAARWCRASFGGRNSESWCDEKFWNKTSRIRWKRCSQPPICPLSCR